MFETAPLVELLALRARKIIKLQVRAFTDFKQRSAMQEKSQKIPLLCGPPNWFDMNQPITAPQHLSDKIVQISTHFSSPTLTTGHENFHQVHKLYPLQTPVRCSWTLLTKSRNKKTWTVMDRSWVESTDISSNKRSPTTSILIVSISINFDINGIC